MTAYVFNVSCTWVTDKQTGLSAECLRIIFMFIMFIRFRSFTLNCRFLFCFVFYSWQSTCDFTEYILFHFNVFEQNDYGTIVLGAA